MEPEPQPQARKASYHIPAIATVIFWSAAYPVTRLCLQHFSAVNLAFLRYAFASAALLLIASRKGIRLPARADIPLFVVSGACGFFLYMTLFCTGSVTANSATSSVVIAVTPVITALLARLVLGEKLPWIKWVAIGVEFAGILVLTLMNGVLSVNIGIFYLAAAAFALAAYNLLLRKITRTYSAFDATLFSVLAGTAMLAIFLPGTVHEVMTAPTGSILYAAFLGIVPSGLAFIFWSEALKRAENTSSVSNYMFVTPFIATLLGFLLAGEKPDAATLVGGAVIMAGLFLFIFGGKFFPTSRQQ